LSEETVGYVELEWTCKFCGARNRGAQKTCSSCGSAMSKEDQFELPAQQELITDAAKIAKAERGPDVMCPYCGARNVAGATSCTQCGGDLTSAEARAKGRVLGALQTAPVPDVPCPFCSTPNPANANKCKNCGGVLGKAPAAPPKATATPVGIPKAVLLLGGVAAVLLLCLCVALFALSMQTADTSAVVQGVSWERSIEIMELRPVEHEDWRDQIPAGSPLGSCTRKVRRTQDQPAPGAEKVCGTPYVKDTGTGMGKVVQDCQYRVYDDWCKYTRDEWTKKDKIVARGNDLNPQWPNLRLPSGQREGDRGETYQVIFDADGKRYTHSVNKAEEFSKFTIGSRWTLKVNTFGTVTSAQPK